MSLLENVRLREEAAARCTAKIKWKVLKKQDRKARAEHQVKCCLQKNQGKGQKKAAVSTEDRKELQRHTERQQSKRTRRRDHERDDQKVAHGNDPHCCEVFSGTIHGLDGISMFVEDRETGLFEETRRCPEEMDQKLQSNSVDIGDVKVVCILYHSAPGEGEGAQWKNLHVGGVDGISCQHLKVMVTNLLPKHWELQEERNPLMRHGTVERPTMYLASLDIKTAFNDSKPMHVTHILDSHNTHGWLIAALLREMSGLEGNA